MKSYWQIPGQILYLFLLLVWSACNQAGRSSQSILITHVRLIDGSGSPAMIASVRIKDGYILDIGMLQPNEYDSVIDGQGKVLAPGFIDAHSHHLGYILREPSSAATASQGITTIVIGQDGSSEPMDSLKKIIAKQPFAVNIASYTGQTSLREQVMGENELLRPATISEINQMCQILGSELSKGSLGLSTGLEYEGAFYSTKEEVMQLAERTAREGGRYISHLRSEDIKLDEALDEIIEIGRRTSMPVQISHIKIADRKQWGSADKIISKLEKARQEGIDIRADIYPYTFWNSTLKVLFPDKKYTSIESAELACHQLFDPDSSMLVKFLPMPAYEGQMLGDIARSRKENPAKTLVSLLAIADDYKNNNPDAQGIEAIAGKSMHESDLKTFMRWKYTVFCTDGNAGRHPRGFGSFPRILGLYVREGKTLSLEEAIHKMTGLTAQSLGIQKRGLIKKGYAADLVLFDPDTIIDQATLTDSKAWSKGIISVWVNGKAVLENGQSTSHQPGQLIKR